MKITNAYYFSLLLIVIFPTTIALAEEKTNITNSYSVPTSSVSLNDTYVDFATNIDLLRVIYLLQFQINK